MTPLRAARGGCEIGRVQRRFFRRPRPTACLTIAEVPVATIVGSVTLPELPPPATLESIRTEPAQHLGLSFIHDAFGIVQEIANRLARLIRLVFNRVTHERAFDKRSVDDARFVTRTVL